MGVKETEVEMQNEIKLPELIGLAGTFASGKDTLASRLVLDHDYVHVSTGDMVRKVARQERGSIERPVLHEAADAHRKDDGAGYFAQQALQEPRPLVVSGLRTMGEVKVIKNAGGVIVFVDAPVEVRYERAMNRRRDGEDKLSLDEFKASEASEWYAGDTDADFNLRDIKAGADIVVENVASLDEFISRVSKRLAEL